MSEEKKLKTDYIGLKLNAGDKVQLRLYVRVKNRLYRVETKELSNGLGELLKLVKNRLYRVETATICCSFTYPTG